MKQVEERIVKLYFEADIHNGDAALCTHAEPLALSKLVKAYSIDLPMTLETRYLSPTYSKITKNYLNQPFVNHTKRLKKLADFMSCVLELDKNAHIKLDLRGISLDGRDEWELDDGGC